MKGIMICPAVFHPKEMAAAVSLYVISYMAERGSLRTCPQPFESSSAYIYRSYSCRPSKRQCSRWARRRRGRSCGGTGTARTASTTGLVAPQVPARLLSSDRLDAPTCRTTTTGVQASGESLGKGRRGTTVVAVATLAGLQLPRFLFRSVAKGLQGRGGARGSGSIQPTIGGPAGILQSKQRPRHWRRLQFRKRRSRRACHRAATRQPP